MTVRCPHSWQCQVRCPSVIGPPPHRHAAHPTRYRVEPQPQRGGVGSLQPFGPLGGAAQSSLPRSKGAPWKAKEIEYAASYFDVPVADLFDGLGLFRDAKRPHRSGGASLAGAPSGTRTPDPLIKSQLL